MRVAIISDCETAGGAAVATSRLATGLSGLGMDVTRFVARPDNEPHPWHTRELPGRTLPKVFGYVRQIGGGRAGLYALSRWTKARLSDALELLRPDVINLHNLHGALGWSPEIVEYCASYAPVVWTMHDMWSFTGRCAYSYECRKFIEGCDAACPTPYEYPALPPGRIASEWRLRQRILGENPHAVAVSPSRWLATEASVGLWAGHRIEVIPYGLSLDTYAPLDRQRARDALGIDDRASVLLVVADKLGDRRKGGQLLVDALPLTYARPLTVVTVGSGKLDIPLHDVNVRPLGYVKDEYTKVLAYNAADAVVNSAVIDNLPNVVMESIACGTPVVSFSTGGLPEMVRPGLTGWLANELSAKSLAAAVDHALAATGRASDLRQSCRSVAVAEYGLQLQAERYVELFRSLTRVKVSRTQAATADQPKSLSPSGTAFP